MFDFHNHFTDTDGFKYSDELLPQNLVPLYLRFLSESGKNVYGVNDDYISGIDSEPDEESGCFKDNFFPGFFPLLNVNLIGCSEIGLDKRFAKDIPLDYQVKILHYMLLYAKERRIGVSLHCVGADGYLLDLLKRVKPLPFKCVWHGFNGSAETAKELYKLKVIISIGPRFNKDLKAITSANPYYVPETDYTGDNSLEHKRILSGQYEKCSKLLHISIEELEFLVNERKRAFTA